APEEEEVSEGEEGEGVQPKKKLSMKMMLIAGAAALVVVGGGGTAGFILLKPKPHAAGKPGKASAKKGKDGKDKKDVAGAGQVREGPDGVLFYTMPDLVVNMQTADGRPTF